VWLPSAFSRLCWLWWLGAFSYKLQRQPIIHQLLSAIAEMKSRW
jgi:hypothetical protein